MRFSSCTFAYSGVQSGLGFSLKPGFQPCTSRTVKRSDLPISPCRAKAAAESKSFQSELSLLEVGVFEEPGIAMGPPFIVGVAGESPEEERCMLPDALYTMVSRHNPPETLQINCIIRPPTPFLCETGGTASGKTTVCRKIAEGLTESMLVRFWSHTLPLLLLKRIKTAWPGQA